LKFFSPSLSILAILLLFRPMQVSAEKVRVVYTILGATQSSIWVAAELGFFKKRGLEVELTYITSGQLGLSTLLSGEVDFSVMGGAAVLNAIEKKSDIQIIAIPMKLLTSSLMSSPNLRSPSDLVGKKVGIPRFGGLSDLMLSHALQLWKIPATKLNIIQLGGNAEILAALQTGQVDAVVLVAPTTFKALELGFKELFDFATMDATYPATTVVTRAKMVQEKPDLVSRLTAGFVEAIGFMKSDRAKTIAVLKKYTRTTDNDVLEKTYDLYMRRYLETLPSADLSVLQSGFRLVGKNEAEIQSLNLTRYLAPRFVEDAKRMAK
jgi:NitT/TauT family transport system substrate-binding protein